MQAYKWPLMKQKKRRRRFKNQEGEQYEKCNFTITRLCIILRIKMAEKMTTFSRKFSILPKKVGTR